MQKREGRVVCSLVQPLFKGIIWEEVKRKTRIHTQKKERERGEGNPCKKKNFFSQSENHPLPGKPKKEKTKKKGFFFILAQTTPSP